MRPTSPSDDLPKDRFAKGGDSDASATIATLAERDASPALHALAELLARLAASEFLQGECATSHHRAMLWTALAALVALVVLYLAHCGF
jgi:hypothetical protein